MGSNRKILRYSNLVIDHKSLPFGNRLSKSVNLINFRHCNVIPFLGNILLFQGTVLYCRYWSIIFNRSSNHLFNLVMVSFIQFFENISWYFYRENKNHVQRCWHGCFIIYSWFLNRFIDFQLMLRFLFFCGFHDLFSTPTPVYSNGV